MKKFTTLAMGCIIMATAFFLFAPTVVNGQEIKRVTLPGFPLVGHEAYRASNFDPIWNSRAWSSQSMVTSAKADATAIIAVYVSRSTEGYKEPLNRGSLQDAIDGGMAVDLGADILARLVALGMPRERIKVTYLPQASKDVTVEMVVEHPFGTVAPKPATPPTPTVGKPSISVSANSGAIVIVGDHNEVIIPANPDGNAPAPMSLTGEVSPFYAYVGTQYREYALTTSSPVFSVEALGIGYAEQFAPWLLFRAETSLLNANMVNSSAIFSSESQHMYFTGDARVDLQTRWKLVGSFGLGGRGGAHLAYNWTDGLRDRVGFSVGGDIFLGPAEASATYYIEELQPNPTFRGGQDTLQTVGARLSYRPFRNHDWRIFVSSQQVKFMGSEYIRFLDYDLGFGTEFRYGNWFLSFQGQKYSAWTQDVSTGQIIDPPGWLFQVEGKWVNHFGPQVKKVFSSIF